MLVCNKPKLICNKPGLLKSMQHSKFTGKLITYQSKRSRQLVPMTHTAFNSESVPDTGIPAWPPT
jgi:hypothetical protein